MCKFGACSPNPRVWRRRAWWKRRESPGGFLFFFEMQLEDRSGLWGEREGGGGQDQKGTRSRAAAAGAPGDAGAEASRRPGSGGSRSAARERGAPSLRVPRVAFLPTVPAPPLPSPAALACAAQGKPAGRGQGGGVRPPQAWAASPPPRGLPCSAPLHLAAGSFSEFPVHPGSWLPRDQLGWGAGGGGLVGAERGWGNGGRRGQERSGLGSSARLASPRRAPRARAIGGHLAA